MRQASHDSNAARCYFRMMEHGYRCCFFCDTTNTCFLTLVSGSDLFYEANVNKIPCSIHPRKNWQLQTDRNTTMLQWLYADLK